MDWAFPEASEQDRAGKSLAGPGHQPLHPAHGQRRPGGQPGAHRGRGCWLAPSHHGLAGGSCWQGGAAAPLGQSGGSRVRVPLPQTRCSPGFSSLRLSPLPVSHRSSTGGIQTKTKPGMFCNQEKTEGSPSQQRAMEAPNTSKTLLCVTASAPATQASSSLLHSHSQASPQPHCVPGPGFPPRPSRPRPSTEGPRTAQGAASTHGAPKGSRGLVGDKASRARRRGCSVAGRVDAGRGRKAAIPVPIADPIPVPQWGLFWRLWAGCGPAGSVPDSHPCWLGGSFSIPPHRAGTRDGRWWEPLPQPGPAATLPRVLPPRQPRRKNPCHRPGTQGTQGAVTSEGRLEPPARAGVPRGRAAAERGVCTK
ncbi:MAP7 domain-containing protein 1-like [Falco cherrug]|uniref:MAP7 domain-containing protein 1-like n=1 Tax=Falco cherrug TaxID=345164 RepID=UPI00247A6C70|nr:MAP7 domain-containing protein 1-like [Falco cherrug]